MVRTFFWQFDDYNDIERQWAMFVLNILAFLFTSWALVQTVRHHSKCVFQLVPLTLNMVGTLLLLLIKLFEKGYQFDLVGYLAQFFTYFLFCYTFALMHFRVIAVNRHKTKNLCNILLIFFGVGCIVMIILVMSGLVAKNCQNDMFGLSLASFLTELVSFIPTAYFGIDILRKIIKKHDEQKQQRLVSITYHAIFTPISDEYVRERKKQIFLVLLAYAFSLIMRSLVLLFVTLFNDYFDCNDCEGVFIITSDYSFGQFILVLVEINQLIPHIAIPIALYVVPIQRGGRKNPKIMIDDSLLIEEERDDEDHSDIIQRRISNSLSKSTTSLNSKSNRQIDPN